MKFRVTPDAYDDLCQIEDWVTEHFGSSYAAKTKANLFAQFELLADFPHMGLIRLEISSRPIRFFFSGHYWIVYEPDIPLIITASSTPLATYPIRIWPEDQGCPYIDARFSASSHNFPTRFSRDSTDW